MTTPHVPVLAGELIEFLDPAPGATAVDCTVGGAGHARLRSILVIVEVAAALVLLVVAGLLLRSFDRMRSVDLGFKTDHMLFGPATFISRMSQYLTLYPGDIVWMGTEGAPENVKHGDTIDIEITGIGTLSNPVVREGR